MIVQQQRFRVVFTGQFDPNKNIDAIKADMTARFKLPPPIIERLMAGRPIVVKNNVNAETAYRYKREIDVMGGVSRIEAVPEEDDVDKKGFIERRKRKSDRRMRNDRRKVKRAGAIQPDRRKGMDRRKNNGSGD